MEKFLSRVEVLAVCGVVCMCAYITFYCSCRMGVSQFFKLHLSIFYKLYGIES